MVKRINVKKLKELGEQKVKVIENIKKKKRNNLLIYKQKI